MIGKIIQNYKLEKNIGEGGMGDVYLAKHLHLDKKVAIKILNIDPKKHIDLLKRFEIEAKVLNKLKHKNIVEIIDYSELNGVPYIIMEFIDGVTLEEHIKSGVGIISDKKATKYLLQILEALEYAHNSGIIHRDLKPSNFILDKEDNLKILDFGIAKIISDTENHQLTRMGQGIGTLPYMSPEQILMTNEIRKTTDIYSLGVCLYQMLTGKEPYSQQLTRRQVEDKIIAEPLPPIKETYPSASDKMQAIIDKAMQKNESDRFQSCEEFADALKAEDILKPIIVGAISEGNSQESSTGEKPESVRNETETELIEQKNEKKEELEDKQEKEEIEQKVTKKKKKTLKTLIAIISALVLIVIFSFAFVHFSGNNENNNDLVEIAEIEKNDNLALTKAKIEQSLNKYSNSSKVIENDRIWVENKEGKFGFLDETGAEKIECKYDTVTNFSEFFPNFAAVKLAKKYGFINTQGILTIQLAYTEIAPFDDKHVWFSKQKNGKTVYGKMNANGEESKLPCGDDFHKGFTISQSAENSLFGLKSLKCKDIINPKYKELTWLVKGKTLKAKNADNTFGIIDVNGKTLVDFKYSSFSLNNQARSAKYNWKVRLKSNNKIGLLNSNFQESIPCEYEIIGYRSFWGNGYFVVETNGKKGVFDKQRGEIIPCIYKQVYWESEYDWFWVQLPSTKWGALNKSGTNKLNCIYDSEPKAVDNLIIVQKNGMYGAISKNGIIKINFVYRELKSAYYTDKYSFRGKKGGLMYFFDNEGKIINNN